KLIEIWTRKEAFLKMIGLGLYTELTDISVTSGKNLIGLDLPVNISVKSDKAFLYTQKFNGFFISVALSKSCPVYFKSIID
ncbi:MAG TPA: 4'-phosphopantetheinyl transferase superfamily protein, partial [Bacteroidales bacterium]|nr:4'-phosphopantetheinyl transferase superfamily protein [Bacteroidales bacterium]